MAFAEGFAENNFFNSGSPQSPFGAMDSDLSYLFPSPVTISLPTRHPAESAGNGRPAVSSFYGAAIRSEEYGDLVLSLFERSGVGLAVLDPSLRIQAVNRAFSVQCGRHGDEVCDRSIAELLHPSVRQYLMHQFGRLALGQHARLVSRSVTMWFHDTALAGKLTAFPVEDEAGRVKLILAQFTPERAEEGRPGLVGSQWKLTALTARILEGVAAGDPTIRLAAKLFLSRQGVEYHVSILLRQFKVPNRTALAAKAYSMGMFSIGSWPPKLLPDYIRPERAASPERAGAERAGADAPG